MSESSPRVYGPCPESGHQTERFGLGWRCPHLFCGASSDVFPDWWGKVTVTPALPGWLAYATGGGRVAHGLTPQKAVEALRASETASKPEAKPTPATRPILAERDREAVRTAIRSVFRKLGEAGADVGDTSLFADALLAARVPMEPGEDDIASQIAEFDRLLSVNDSQRAEIERLRAEVDRLTTSEGRLSAETTRLRDSRGIWRDRAERAEADRDDHQDLARADITARNALEEAGYPVEKGDTVAGQITRMGIAFATRAHIIHEVCKAAGLPLTGPLADVPRLVRERIEALGERAEKAERSAVRWREVCESAEKAEREAANKANSDDGPADQIVWGLTRNRGIAPAPTKGADLVAWVLAAFDKSEWKRANAERAAEKATREAAAIRAAYNRARGIVSSAVATLGTVGEVEGLLGATASTQPTSDD